MRVIFGFAGREVFRWMGAGVLLASCLPDETAPGAGRLASAPSIGAPVAARDLTSAAARERARTGARRALAKLTSTRRWGALDSLVREPLRTRRLVVPDRPPSGELQDIPERFRAFSESIETERLLQGIPGVAVGIVERGELTFARGFGTKGPEDTDRVRPGTLFRIASNTKPFTAVSVLQQVDRGELAIDDALVEHLPTFGLDTTPEPLPSITLRQLLSHTSGLADYIDIDVPDEQKTDDALGEFLLGPFRELGYLQSPPGVLFSYSNAGYSLLGLVAEVQTGVPFRRLVRERVWKPLGMRRTFFEPSDVLTDGDYALGSCPPDVPECAGEGLGSVFAPDSYDAPSSAPAGSAWSSVIDLARWARFLLYGNPGVLSDPLRGQMASPQVSTRFAGDIVSYGLGLQHQSLLVSLPDPAGPVQFHAATAIYHGGALPGFRSLVTCVPSLEFCFIGLANYDEVDFFGMEAAALRLVSLPDPIPLPDIAPVPDRFPEYAGTYVDPFALGLLTIAFDEARIFIDWPLLDELGIAYGRELIPSSVDNFAFELDGSIWPLTFLAGPGGGFDYVRTIDRYVATRVEGAEIASSRPGARGTVLHRALERRDF